jgi:hypothetical protein
MVGLSSTAWVSMMKGTVNAAFNASSQRVTAIANPQIAPVFNPFCLFEDVCEWLGRLGSGPLTGGGGTEEVLAPFYQDVTVHAKNSNRESIRACDVVMPSKAAIRFKNGDFTADPSHPLAGTVSLSSFFYEALYNSSTSVDQSQTEPHILDYDAVSSPLAEKTGNWHHVARYGNYVPTIGWQHGPLVGDLIARKYVWKKSIPYGPPTNPTQNTLEIWFQMEHTMSSDVRLDPVANGGPNGYVTGNDQYRGLWGALFTIGVFTDEITFVDNSTSFQPIGWQAGTTWRRSNPCIYGGANQVISSETVDTYTKRGIHPQCVALAHLPTTFHAPVGRMHASQANNKFYRQFMGSFDGLARNLDDCLLVPNGSPWLNTSACTAPCPCRQPSWPTDSWGVLENIVFGRPSGGPNYYGGKGMTLGGDMKRSRPMDWPCWENGGSGTGLTFLKVAKPGWSESCGELDVLGGNSSEFWLCIDNGDCPLDNDQCGESDGEWPVTVGMSNCDGHPAEKYMGVGGSHTCIRTASGPQLNGGPGSLLAPSPPDGTYVCCVPPFPATIVSNEHCVRNFTSVGEVLDGNCTEIVSGCEPVNTFFTQWVVFITQYSLGPFENVLNRAMHWSRILPGPDATDALRNWTYLSSDVDLINTLGSFNRNPSNLTVASTTGSGPIRAACRYNKYEISGGTSTWDWFGCDITCTFTGVSATGPQGLGFLDSSNNGYGLNVVKSGSDMVMQICRYSVGVKTVLASYTFVAKGGDNTGVARFRIHGVDILASYTPSTGIINTLTVTDGVEWQRQALVARVPDISNPSSDSQSPFKPSFYTEHNAGGGVFGTFPNPLITDLVPKFYNVYGFKGSGTLNTSLSTPLMFGYNKCTDTSSNILTCGSDEFNCNCISWSEQMFRSTSSSHTGPSDIYNNQLFSGCSAIDAPCDPQSTWLDGNPQYHGGPPPTRCKCQGEPCSSGAPICSDCPTYQSPRIAFSLPTSKDCWDGAGNPDCLGTIPLLCYGIDSYVTSYIACS